MVIQFDPLTRATLHLNLDKEILSLVVSVEYDFDKEEKLLNKLTSKTEINEKEVFHFIYENIKDKLYLLFEHTDFERYDEKWDDGKLNLFYSTSYSLRLGNVLSRLYQNSKSYF